MKFTISTQELNYLLSRILSAVSPKATTPILNNILIEAFNDELTLTATDLTVGIRCHTDTTIIEEGATTLPAKRFSQLIRELTASNVEITTNAQEITTIVAGSSKFKLNGMNREAFPALPDVSGSQSFSIKQSDLRDLLFSTAFAASKDDDRYALMGVLFKIESGKLTCMGTDGKRLARVQQKIEIDPTFKSESILPIKAVEEIIKCLSEEGDAKVHILSDKISVEANQTQLVTKLVSGEYPDLSRIIPQKFETITKIHREELISLLRQISLFILDPLRSVKFVFQEGELKLSVNTMDVGEGDVSMAVNYQGPKMEIAFNPGLFMDVLRHCKDETVTMGLIDSYNPGVITDQEELNAESSPLFVNMPMRISED